MAGSGFRTRNKICSFVGAGTILSFLATPALAQDTAAKNVFDGDYVVVGAGVLAGPDYKGSNDSHISPGFGAAGEVGGIGFTIRGPSLSTDLISDPPGADVRFRFGPQVRLRSNRSSKVDDPVVAALGKLDRVVEAGFRVGISVDDVLSRKDSLSAGVSARWDISGKHSGMVLSPSATYRLPVSRAQVFGVQLSTQFADGKYADYNYAVSPEGAAASGLPVYNAKGGFHEASLGIATARDLDGDFLNGGFAIGVGAMYSRLFGSAAHTPITSIRGDRDQWVFGAGLSYTF